MSHSDCEGILSLHVFKLVPPPQKKTPMVTFENFNRNMSFRTQCPCYNQQTSLGTLCTDFFQQKVVPITPVHSQIHTSNQDNFIFHSPSPKVLQHTAHGVASLPVMFCSFIFVQIQNNNTPQNVMEYCAA